MHRVENNIKEELRQTALGLKHYRPQALTHTGNGNCLEQVVCSAVVSHYKMFGWHVSLAITYLLIRKNLCSRISLHRWTSRRSAHTSRWLICPSSGLSEKID